jgi:hypothetical protein
MSWGTNYVTSNNLNIPYPGIVHDGRLFTSYSPSAVLNDKIKSENHITTDREYRTYLVNNADMIMKYNFNTMGTSTSTSLGRTYPYTFYDVNDRSLPPGYETSIPKNLYLTREQLVANETRPMLSSFK